MKDSSMFWSGDEHTQLCYLGMCGEAGGRLCAGMDGFYDRRSCFSPGVNPSSWGGYTGQDFLPQHAVQGARHPRGFAAISNPLPMWLWW